MTAIRRELSMVGMSRVDGLSEARLARLAERMRGFVERGEVAGLVVGVARRGQVHVETFGAMDVATGAPMQRDTIFRIASMSKPILATAALMLVEEATLRLDAPVDPWLPELANRRVLRSLDADLDDTVPADRPITLRDLLTLRLGIGAVMAPEGTYPVQRAIAEAGIDPGLDGLLPPADDWMARLGALPLLHQPGERWMYHTGFDVLAVLLERVAGRPLGEFLAERVYAPLGMVDTAFSVPASAIDRLASSYTAGPAGALVLSDPGPGGRFAAPPAFASEVVSTVDDYLKFSAMLLGQGRSGATRLLSRPAVELMTTDQITEAQKAASPFFPGFWDATGWGMGLAVVTRRTDIAAAPGRIGWSGGFGTAWFADPHEDLSAVLLAQRHHDGVVGRLHADFHTLVYQAIDD
jgi:CubicO group peptidase (beta-lactamase class C family)